MEQLPPPPAQLPWKRGPRWLTARTGAFLGLAVYLVGIYVAFLALRPFASVLLIWQMIAVAPLAAVAGAWAGSVDDPGGRSRAVFLVLFLALLLPLATAAWLPGIAQERLHRFPGNPDVALAAAPDHNLDLYLYPDGNPDRLIELTDTPDRAERLPSLAPDGRSLLFVADADDGSADLFLMHLDGVGHPTGTELLLDGPNNLSDSDWSPDGKTILVRSDREEVSAIYRYDVRTGALDPFLDLAYNPAWSPDGSTVAFSAPNADEPQNLDLYVVDADGSHRRRVIDTGFDDFFPVWSPDGTRLAFASEAHGGDEDVFTVNLDGSGLRILTANHDGDDAPELWGPNDDILFLSDRPGGDAVWGYLMKPDGSDVRLFSRL